MTEVIFHTEASRIVGFEAKGHSGYAEEGSDIVCAAVSSAAYMAANTVTDVQNLPCSVTADDGYMEMHLSKQEAEQAQVILNGLLLHLDALCKEYPVFINLKISYYEKIFLLLSNTRTDAVVRMC